MSDSIISLKVINDLLKHQDNEPTQFWIPAYQRGYRWSALQVTQLLDDIREFNLRQNPQPEDFYCLQPLVLKDKHTGLYEVVDGQQRLTTILLILRHFNERLAEKYRQKLFTIDYETRPKLLDFLDDPTEELANSNVDYFHLFGAIQAVERWFVNKDNEVDDIKSALLNKTKVIWFELSKRDNPVDAFTRLNVGKIPLTNDELIRALFLKNDVGQGSEALTLQRRIAHEWDQLEKALQKDSFWYFINNQPAPDESRISFLFDLIINEEERPNIIKEDGYRVFYAYSKKLKDEKIPAADEWLKVKQAYMILEEWFEDRTLYHIVGFLIQQGMDVNEIRQMSKDSTKSDFEFKLRSEVFAIFINEINLDELNEAGLKNQIEEYINELKYGKNSSEIRSVLLLFNLATLLENSRSNLRFQFENFKNENWDIEHVRSIASAPPVRHHDRVEWSEGCLRYFEAQGVKNVLEDEIHSFINDKSKDLVKETEIFDSLYEKVLDYFDENEDDDTTDDISNLTLLDQSTNRSYKNAVFAVKRQKLLSLDQSGIFVPLCTRNVFLKCYSSQVDNVMFWGKADRESYRQVIVDTLYRFFSISL